MFSKQLHMFDPLYTKCEKKGYLRKRRRNLLSPRLCFKVKKYVSSQRLVRNTFRHNGWLVYLAQWFPKYGLKPKGGEWSKKGRASKA